MKTAIIALAFTVSALACQEPDSAITAVNPRTGEIESFPDPESVPDGWILCEDADCSDWLPGECDPEECGEPLDFPTLICSDGSTGGNTGVCLHTANGDCTWEVRECPTGPSTCEESACGDPLEMPAYWCEDGTVGGNTGNCLSVDGDRCAWEIRECPDGDDLCEEAECGEPLEAPLYLCEDGTLGGNTGRCLRNTDGVCAWEMRACPDDVEAVLCEDASECGPMPGAPAYYCEDGTIGGFTGRCLQREGDACAWEVRSCPA